jgi:hypothetical protein
MPNFYPTRQRDIFFQFIGVCGGPLSQDIN